MTRYMMGLPTSSIHRNGINDLKSSLTLLANPVEVDARLNFLANN